MSCVSNTANHLVKLQEQASLLRVVGRFKVWFTDLEIANFSFSF